MKKKIKAIAKHIETIYIKPSKPIRIPPWIQWHGIRALDIHEAVSLAATAAKKGEGNGRIRPFECVHQKPKGGGNRVYRESHTGKLQSQERLPGPLEISPRAVVA